MEGMPEVCHASRHLIEKEHQGEGVALVRLVRVRIAQCYVAFRVDDNRERKGIFIVIQKSGNREDDVEV